MATQGRPKHVVPPRVRGGQQKVMAPPPPRALRPPDPPPRQRLTDEEMARCLVWAPCPQCGKERELFVRDGAELPELVDAYHRMMAMSLCKACEMEHYQARDACPEHVTINDPGARGTSACRLTWKHEGRCQPWSDEGERAAMAAQWRAEHDAV